MELSEETLFPLVDTHAHVTWESFSDVSAVMARARAAGVSRVLTAATDIATAERAVAIAGSFPEVYAAVGVHPNDVEGEIDRSALRAMARAAKVVAIGETGLDYYRDHTLPQDQRRAFRVHLDLAVELGLPIVIHNRSADVDVLAAVRDYPRLRGVLHCFSSSAEIAEQGLALGLHLSFAGNLTYPKAAGIREVAGWAPLDRVLVETDAPFLAPLPHRGRRNEPAYVRYTLEALARCRSLELGEMAEQVAANARALFGW